MEETDFTNPQSRVEKILAKTIQEYTGDLEDPQSRIEKLLVKLNSYIAQLAEGGSSITPDWEIDDKNKAGFIKNKPHVYASSGGEAVMECGALDASGVGAHAEGYDTIADSGCAHAEGRETRAEGYASHAEGFKCEAQEDYSHAEGHETKAETESAHSEGSYTTASGYASHAEGCGTTAAGEYQHCFGAFNIADEESTYLEIAGNGTDDDTRSNARTLDKKGNEWLAGKLTVSTAPAEDMDVTTKKYVDDLIAELKAKIEALTPASS